MKMAGVLTAEEMETMFVNLRDIRRCNIKLLKYDVQLFHIMHVQVRPSVWVVCCSDCRHCFSGFRVRKRTYEGGSIHMIGDILCENVNSYYIYSLSAKTTPA